MIGVSGSNLNLHSTIVIESIIIFLNQLKWPSKSNIIVPNFLFTLKIRLGPTIQNYFLEAFILSIGSIDMLDSQRFICLN